jgi:hypothetical protein
MAVVVAADNLIGIIQKTHLIITFVFVREWINGFRALFGGMPADGGGHATARRPSNAIHRRARLVI